MKRLKEKIVGSRRSSNRLYRPLRKEVCEIRLLSILPSDKPDTVLCCNLEHVRLDRAPRYKALSYAWGDASFTEEIYVNGHVFHATSNLHAALDNFRSTCPGIHIWVDAICVNQDNLLERGHQVQLMQKIYSKADETFVWLGTEADESEKAIEFIKLLSDVFTDCRNRTPPNLTHYFGYWGSPIHWNAIGEFEALFSIFDRAWWYRVWIVQEVAVSRSISLHCGYRTCSWLEVRQACWFSQFLKDEVLELFPSNDNRRERCRRMLQGMGRVSNINSLREAFGPSLELKVSRFQRSILSLLANHRPAESTDPRDKFIALAGLTTDAILRSNVNVYFNSVADTFTTATKMIAETQAAAPLNFLDHSGSPRDRDDLPSWVPDWSCTRSRLKEILFWQNNPYYGARHSIKYNASCQLTSNPGRRFKFDDNRRSLLADGIHFDTLDISGATTKHLEMKEVLKMPDFESEEFKGCELEKTSQLKGYPKETNSDVLWRTLVMNRTLTSGTALPTEWGSLWTKLIPQFDNILFFDGSRYHNWNCPHTPFRAPGKSVGDIVLSRIFFTAPPVLSPTEKEQIPKFTRALQEICIDRRISVTEKNYLCHAPSDIEHGDIIAVLFNCDAPVILRRQGEKYRFIGTCYVHGIMQGEAMAGIQEGTAVPQTFDIR